MYTTARQPDRTCTALATRITPCPRHGATPEQAPLPALPGMDWPCLHWFSSDAGLRQIHAAVVAVVDTRYPALAFRRVVRAADSEDQFVLAMISDGHTVAVAPLTWSAESWIAFDVDACEWANGQRWEPCPSRALYTDLDGTFVTERDLRHGCRGRYHVQDGVIYFEW